LALTAGLVAVTVIGGGGFMLGQRSAQNRPAPVLQAAVVPAPIPSPTQSSSRMLGRAGLLALAAEAADATARGDPMPATVRDAIGKPFAMSLPFGCEGPAAADSDAPMRWQYDDTAGALRLSVTPVTWSPAEWWAGDPPSDAETIEGFWISRPWTLSETCPASPTPVAPAGTEPVTLPGQTLAIGQMFGPESARHGRRDGKAYSSVLRMGRAEMGGSRGLALRLTGRIGSGPNGTPATCRQPGGADQRPACLILVSLDELAIADPVSNTVLAAWQTGSLSDADDAR
jgi:hypothetical protein